MKVNFIKFISYVDISAYQGGIASVNAKASVTFDSCVIRRIITVEAGVAYLTDATLKIINSVISELFANNNAVITIINDSIISIDGSIFENNVAYFSNSIGQIADNNQFISITNSIFRNNYATESIGLDIMQ